jgi:thiol:disulfide interchange protein
MLKADWTTRDPAITRALGEFGRSGVPLYVLYSPDPFAAPRLLPEVLTPAIVMRALRDARS